MCSSTSAAARLTYTPQSMVTMTWACGLATARSSSHGGASGNRYACRRARRDRRGAPHWRLYSPLLRRRTQAAVAASVPRPYAPLKQHCFTHVCSCQQAGGLLYAENAVKSRVTLRQGTPQQLQLPNLLGAAFEVRTRAPHAEQLVRRPLTAQTARRTLGHRADPAHAQVQGHQAAEETGEPD